MGRVQRVILLLGFVSVLHSSMVPPIQQYTNDVCRYAEFVERGVPFTRTYAVANADVVALVSEYGIIAAVVGIAYLVAGAFTKRAG